MFNIYIKSKDANDAWIKTIKYLKKYGKESAPRSKRIKEILGYNICIENPKNKIIYCPTRKMSLPYAVGEFIYYITGDNSLEFIQYYSNQFKNFTDDDKTINSAYGHRIFGYTNLIDFNQWEHVKKQLKEDIDTRQAIIHLHLPNNKKTNDELCTLTLQFIIRNNKLNLFVNMRSNDIIWGFTYNVFNFTLFQELMANELNIEVGYYYHNAASMHIYEKDWNKLKHIRNKKPKNFNLEFNLDTITLNDKRLLKLIELEEIIRLSYDINDIVNINDDLNHNTLNLMLKILKQYKIEKMFKNKQITEHEFNMYRLNVYDKHFFK